MKHKFVEFIPDEIENDVLYISMEYDVAKHKCPCGCGTDIITTLSPVGWKLIYDGETVSLYPSIGNWKHPCKSHYYIRRNEIKWVGSISNHSIKKVIKKDNLDKMEYYSINNKGFNKWLRRIRKKSK